MDLLVLMPELHLESTAQSPKALLIHHGELADLQRLLVDLGVDFTEHKSEAPSPHSRPGWALLIATTQRMIDEGITGNGESVCMAVADGDSPGLRATMRRMGIDIIVRRPAHPAAVRLLMLHSLYRGPERRSRQRVSVGADIRFRVGLKRHHGVLVDLSLGGCRINAHKSIAPGKRIALAIPPADPTKNALSLRGVVIRSGPAPDEDAAAHSISLRFDVLDASQRDQLGDILLGYSHGPATLPPEGQEPPEPSIEAEPGEDAGAERRRASRKQYGSRVIALDPKATRVLLGRDISTGGMRVDASSENLAVGDHLRLALHVQAHRAPLVVDARVERDDGARGMVLRFLGLDDDQGKALAETVDHLPPIEFDQAAEAEGRELVVSEILPSQAEGSQEGPEGPQEGPEGPQEDPEGREEQDGEHEDRDEPA